MQPMPLETLILLVGSNPLPNYLVAKFLKPKQIFLIHTEQTCGPAKRLSSVLGNQAKIEMRKLESASNASKIAETIRSIISNVDPQQVHLNYTGGTKIMAAHARMAFREIGGKDQNASYLNDGARCLFFDDGRHVCLGKEDFELTLDLIGRLHGCEMLPSSGGGIDGPTEKDAATIAARVASVDAKLAESLCDTAQRFKKQGKLQKALEQPWCPQEVGLTLSVRQVPEEQWDDKRFKAWWRFLGGVWLEVAVAAWIKDATGASPSQGVCWRLKGREFEIDVALIRNHRLYVISCTTDSTLSRCKSKLFEVAMRSRQLGGDLARSALVCLIDEQDGQGNADQLRRDVASVWEAPNKPQVFGLADLREWTRPAGSPNLDSLKSWLDS